MTTAYGTWRGWVRSGLGLFALASALVGGEGAVTPEGIPRHQEARIRDAAPQAPRAAPRKPRRVLVWSTPPHLLDKDPHKGYCVPYGACAMRILGEKTGAFEAVFRDDLGAFLPESLRELDAVILNNACGAWITPGEADVERLRDQGDSPEAIEGVLRKSLVDYVAGGGGLVAYHYAIGANRHWPEFHELIGASFTGHPWNEEVGVLVEEPGHPLVAAFGDRTFRIADEIYEFGPPYDRSRLRVLLSLDTERTNMGVRWIHREDNDFAQAWVKTYGEGRVFYTGFGHRTEIWWNPQLLQLYLDGIQYATGDLEVPTSPREDPVVRRGPGPTPPEVVAERMKAGSVAAPTDEEVRRIEEAAPEVASAKPAARRRVLVWGRLWTHQPNPFAAKALEILGEKSGAFEVVVSDDPRRLLGDRLSRFDAVVLNNIHERDPFLPLYYGELDALGQAAARKLDEAVKESLLQFVRDGKGLVGIHAATAALQGWPEYGAVIGGYYGGHIHQEVTLKLDDPTHPVNACFGGRPFRIRDEIYLMRDPYSRAHLRVLVSLDLREVEDPGKREDGDYAVSWVRTEGKGRVFYTSLGHDAATYWNPTFLRHLLTGVQLALGDLDGDRTPGP